MPELPEVETVVRDLRPHLVGRTIQRVTAGRQALRRPWKPAWTQAVAGTRIDSLQRRGKWILIALDRGAILGHLGMTGQLTIHNPHEKPRNHTHLRFSLDGESELRYCDIRRFGSLEWFPSNEDMLNTVNDKLGPEPFDATTEYLVNAIRNSDRAIKAILLDQAVLAGVGNIYADESLFRAGIKPQTFGSKLNEERIERLRRAIVDVLTVAIESRGSTIRNYVGGSGLRGGFQHEFAVYGRTDEPCEKCERAIARVVLGGRSTHYCPKCQK